MALKTQSIPVISSSLNKKKIGILTSGGDAQGMNAAIRALTRVSIFHGIEVFGIYEGFSGLIKGGDMIKSLSWDHVSGIIQDGGTILGTARCDEFRTKFGRKCAVGNLLNHGINYLCVIGGDGSLSGASILSEEFSEHFYSLKELKSSNTSGSFSENDPFLNIIGIVASIDNDMFNIEMTIGTDSALHRIVDAADSIKSTAGSHQRVFIIEVMGRHCGHLALMSALATEADFVFLPEIGLTPGWGVILCRMLVQSRKNGLRFNIIILAEGAKDENNNILTASTIKQVIVDRLDYDTRITVLGHIQRGGKPSAHDRILSSRLGAEAANFVYRNDGPAKPIIVAVRGNGITYLPLSDIVMRTFSITEAIKNSEYTKVLELRGTRFHQHLDLYFRLQSPLDQTKAAHLIKICILHVGAPAGGQNPVTYALSRLAISFGHIVYVVSNGFDGLANGDIQQININDLFNWMSEGGSKLGTNRHLPDITNFAGIASNLEKFNIGFLVIIGGFEGYLSLSRLESVRDTYPIFKIPIVLIPATISNNIPGTEYTLGSDTALNVIQQCIDYLKQSASASRKRVFIVEVQGGFCGYLATMSALAGGADNAYIPEISFNVDSICDDIQKIIQKFKRGTLRGIVIRNEYANPHYTTSFLENIYEALSENNYICRSNILGHLQQGGAPSPFDRLYGCMMALKCMDLVNEFIDNKDIISQHSSVYVLGLIRKSFTSNTVKDLIQYTNFERRTHSDIWWKQIHLLMRILTEHFENNYEGEVIVHD